MVLRAESDHALVFGQLSHAWLSGQLAAAWGNASIDPPQPRAPVALGAEQHDIGWALFDLEPLYDADTGLPRNFLQTGVAEHLEIWRDAPAHLLSQSAHAALVVSLHGRALSELRLESVTGGEAEALREHIAHERKRQQQLASLLGLPPQWLARTQRQMWAWDGISLALCSRWSPFTVRSVPAGDGEAELELRELGERAWRIEPWPFAPERVVVRCQARRIAARFEDAAALRAAWQQAPIVDLEFILERG